MTNFQVAELVICTITVLGIIVVVRQGFKPRKRRFDPVRDCKLYNEDECAHVDGMFCNPDSCEHFNTQ